MILTPDLGKLINENNYEIMGIDEASFIDTAKFKMFKYE